MSREAKLWRKPRLHGKHKPGAHIHISGEELAAAIKGSKMPPVDDPRQLRYRVSSTQTDRRSARLIIEVKRLDDIPEHELD